MATPVLDEAHLQEALKTALVEVLEERSDLLREIFAEVLEDIALVRAIQEGEESGPASREEVFHHLR